MYCANCGVKLADSENCCPLCGTAAYHPDIKREDARPLYPLNRLPKARRRSKAGNGAVIILFIIPVLICFLADIQPDGRLDWFAVVAGALLLAYVLLALPMWFTSPNPVVFVPCDFAAVGLYLLYICLTSGGDWYLSFALPLVLAFCLLTSAVVTLLRYIKKGRLYIWGGAFMLTGALMLLVEFLLSLSFGIPFAGWSFYPLAALVLFGGLLIFLAINRSAREIMERKLFF